MSDKAKKTTPRDYEWKYNGKNPLAKLRDGEPYFFIRAQDQLAGEAVQAYSALLKRESTKAFSEGDEQKSNELMKQALAILRVASFIQNWQDDNRQFVKLPD